MPHLLPDGEAAIWRQFFDFWRQSYDDMTYKAHQRFYNVEFQTFPNQKRYNAEAVTDALTHASAMVGRPLQVWEMGGWDGELAQEMFKAFEDGIGFWHNSEICTEAVKYGWEGERYFAVSPGRWAWQYYLRAEMRQYDIAVLSHVIEHLSWKHLQSLIRMLSEVPLLYIQTPPAMTEDPHPDNWYGTMSTHKLEVGWHDVTCLLENTGYTQIWQKDKARFFGKLQRKEG